MWDFLRANPFVIGALTGSLAAYLLGLIVSHLRREKRWLGYSISSRNIIQQGHTKLAIKYDAKDIVRLDSHAITVRNIGNRPLMNIPVRIECIGGGEIVEHELYSPDGAKTTATTEGPGLLVVSTDLINPGEVVAVGVTIADAKDGQIKVVARGELLEVREIGGRADTEELLEVLLPHVPFFGGLWSDLHRLFRQRRQ